MNLRSRCIPYVRLRPSLPPNEYTPLIFSVYSLLISMTAAKILPCCERPRTRVASRTGSFGEFKDPWIPSSSWCVFRPPPLCWERSYADLEKKSSPSTKDEAVRQFSKAVAEWERAWRSCLSTPQGQILLLLAHQCVLLKYIDIDAVDKDRCYMT